MLQRFFRNRDGGVAPMLALALIPMMAATGAAIDYGRASAARTAMQSALDSTVLMVSSKPGNQSAANDYFNAVFSGREVENLQVTVNTGNANNGTAVTANASGSVKSLVMRAFGIPLINVAVRAAAEVQTDDLGCVLALDPGAAGAASAAGSTTVTLNNCSLYDNSNNTAALTVSGSARIEALSVGVVGDVSGNTSVITTEGVRTGMTPVDDPYKDVQIPSFGACTEQKFNPKDEVTINPGVYCNGVIINAGAVVTFSPGVYYFDRGKFQVNGGSTIKGRGVTLVFTSSTGSDWAVPTINGGAVVDLTAPLFGPTAGVVVLADRRIPAGTTFKLNGGSSQYFGGAVYAPSATIDFVGGSGTSTSCTQVIGAVVVFNGNSSLAVNCSSYKTRPFGARVLRLSA